MKTLTEFSTRNELDLSLAQTVSGLLDQAIKKNGKASIAVSGGSTPKGFFNELSQSNIAWEQVTITLADERWVENDSVDSNTRLVHENLLQNRAAAAKFFHLKRGEEFSVETLNDLNLEANSTVLPLDVLILGMGEDGHTASLFPCSEQIEQGLSIDNKDALLKVTPKTAPHERISFTFSALSQSENIFLHLCGENKKTVLEQAQESENIFEMPIRAFLHHPTLKTQVYWAP
ncbi:6-phosphogluconolactonase [Colwellia sp. E2M01]|uniref:6-phosphogluconolactonase n=1 Tax=Colwellia sp. E2M01 TaxID=2841561 RepID=UPI001C08DDF1|nr:6-phosphogluconolactonase [Colwellia sp. E2M01]MBU2871601.1 6-phosphogluconolactonase [Colwellia sp. E2M01]